ncbi:orotate phosphoribosyltransferase, partial [bacterium]|nr:orotate phosphoribosyltransferase [bacterium]
MDLVALLAAKALRIAPPGQPFTMASGAKSDWYLDCKALTMDPGPLRQIAALLADRIVAAGWGPDGVGGLTLGADPLAFALSREASDRGLCWLPFVVRKQTKERGTRRQVEGNLAAGSS